LEGPGSRYFDDSLRGGQGIRSHFLLVCDRDADASIKGAATQLCALLREVVELRWRARHDVTLVRLEGYVGYSADSREGVGAVNSSRAILERQTLADSASS
jgi:hypothetical protein